jgi:sulfate-transporting ATPase
VLNPDGMVMANIVLVRGTHRWARRLRTRRRDAVSESALADRAGETDPERRDATDVADSVETPVARSQSSAGPRAHPQAGVCELSIRNLSVRFGSVYAVRDLSLDVRAGEVVGLIGPNGAGKTTVIDAASGFIPHEQGTVSVGGADVTKWAPHKRARYGLSRSFQSLELIPDMTIGDNIELGADPADRLAYLKGFVAPVRRRTEQSMGAAAIRGLDLDYVLGVPAAAASYGHRRLAAVARALAGDPKVVLLDEPASGLSTTDSERLSRFVREIADTWQIAVLIVEHNMHFVMDVCDRVAVLSGGQLLSEGPPARIRSDPAVIAAYLGEEPGPDDRKASTLRPAAGPGAAVER